MAPFDFRKREDQIAAELYELYQRQVTLHGERLAKKLEGWAKIYDLLFHPLSEDALQAERALQNYKKVYDFATVKKGQNFKTTLITREWRGVSYRTTPALVISAINSLRFGIELCRRYVKDLPELAEVHDYHPRCYLENHDALLDILSSAPPEKQGKRPAKAVMRLMQDKACEWQAQEWREKGFTVTGPVRIGNIELPSMKESERILAKEIATSKPDESEEQPPPIDEWSEPF